MTVHFKTALIAPCGINCGICLAHLRDKRHCPGCRAPDEGKNPSCVRCAIKNCETLQHTGNRFCFQCEGFPCARIKHLDKRYRARYGLSVLENLLSIKQHGIRAFARQEEAKWACARCGGVICMHRPLCPQCGEKVERPMTIT